MEQKQCPNCYNFVEQVDGAYYCVECKIVFS